MSEKTIEAQMLDRLDLVLIKVNEAEEFRREAERQALTLRNREEELANEARRLRRALAALHGESTSVGEADGLNNQRRTELKREMNRRG